jgi:hypothetical protein
VHSFEGAQSALRGPKSYRLYSKLIPNLQHLALEAGQQIIETALITLVDSELIDHRLPGIDALLLEGNQLAAERPIVLVGKVGRRQPTEAPPSTTTTCPVLKPAFIR